MPDTCARCLGTGEYVWRPTGTQPPGQPDLVRASCADCGGRGYRTHGGPDQAGPAGAAPREEARE